MDAFSGAVVVAAPPPGVPPASAVAAALSAAMGAPLPLPLPLGPLLTAALEHLPAIAAALAPGSLASASHGAAFSLTCNERESSAAALSFIA